jgi:roadblock/LC7 domain-containing protein
MQYRGSWYTPAAGYVAAAGFFAVAVYGFVLAFRKSDEKKD